MSIPVIKSSILFTGTESPKELSYKVAELQRQHDNRIATMEKTIQELENRIAELED